MAMLLHLCFCLVTVIQLTPSHAACDVTKQENDGIQIVVNNCGRSEQVLTNNGSGCCLRNEQVLGQLVTSVSRIETTINGSSCGPSEQRLSQLERAVSQIQTPNSQVVTSVTRMQTTISQLQQDSNATTHALSQLLTTMSQMQTTISQLQRDVAELKSPGRQRNVTGSSRESRWKNLTSV